MLTLSELIAERNKGGKTGKEIGILNDKIESRTAKAKRAFYKFMISKIIFDEKILRSYKIQFYFCSRQILITISIKNIVKYEIMISENNFDIRVDSNKIIKFSEYSKKYPDKFIDLKKYLISEERNKLLDYTYTQNHKYIETDYYDYLQYTLLFLLCNKASKTFYRDIEILIARKIIYYPKPQHRIPSWLQHHQFMNNYYMMGGQ